MVKVDEEKLSKNLPLDFIYKDAELDPQSMILIKYPIALVVVILYLITLWLGPKWMKNRPAYKLKNVLRIYNVFQILFNLYLLTPAIEYPQVFEIMWRLKCRYNKDDVELLEKEHLVLINLYFSCCWRFLFTKMIDLLDTIFMVFMKKNSHITFLHVYHHSGMVLFSWLTIKYAPAFQAIPPCALNTIIHVVMYTYYFLATFGPSVQKYLWWKKYLTTLQMVQFVVDFMYISLLIYNDCSISRAFTNLWLINAAIFLVLFSSFYINTYKNKPNQKIKKEK